MITTEEREYLVSSISELLSEYDYKYTEQAIGEIVDKWAEQKATLIEGFKKHPNYVKGQFMISFKQKYERGINISASNSFGRWIIDYPACEYRDNIPEEIKNRKKGTGDHILPWDLWYFFEGLGSYATQFISEETAAKINEMIPGFRVRKGQKTNKVVNKICIYLGYDKHPDYNREYAKYSDSLNPATFERRTVLSVNPLDYLTMSFGNSWASCHTIDKKNKRNMPNSYEGMYSSGTMSYMLDGTSMVFYTIDNSDDEIECWTQPKINRQMFHYGEEKLIQGRLYPQDNDSCSEEYATYRNIAQSIVATIFDFPNLWTLKTGTNNASEYVKSLGTHYRDYYYYNNCSISRIKGSENEREITVGSKPVCIRCGNEHGYESTIDCCIYPRCKHCGKRMYEGDAITIDGEIYCSDCVYYCDDCKTYHVGKGRKITRYGICVCDNCLNNYVKCESCGKYERRDKVMEINGHVYCGCCVTYCPICETYHANDVTFIKSENRKVCNKCRDKHYVRCRHCGRYEKKENMIELDGHMYCNKCVWPCKHCGKYHPSYALWYVGSEHADVCEACIRKYYEVCERRNAFVRKEHSVEIGGLPFCERCADRILYEDDENLYNDYYHYYNYGHRWNDDLD